MGNLAVLSSLNIADSEARNAVLVWLGAGSVEGGDWGIASSLGVHANDSSSLA